MVVCAWCSLTLAYNHATLIDRNHNLLNQFHTEQLRDCTGKKFSLRGAVLNYYSYVEKDNPCGR
jgi:hypothetical protein